MKNLSKNSFKYNSWFLAHINKICYSNQETVVIELVKYNFISVIPLFQINNKIAGFVIEFDDDIIISIRGISQNNIIPYNTCLKIWYHREQNALVHKGFGTYANYLWPSIKVNLLLHNSKKIWFTGHSMGGSISKLIALKCISEITSICKPCVFTYGSPRIISFFNNIDFNKIELYRWVNNIDLVPGSPSLFFGYCHFSPSYYINRFGNVVKYTSSQIFFDKFKTYFFSLNKISTTHGLSSYLEALERYKNEIVISEK
jgi:triacylglycerol lipase